MYVYVDTVHVRLWVLRDSGNTPLGTFFYVTHTFQHLFTQTLQYLINL